MFLFVLAPEKRMLDGYFSHVPPDFRMSIKVTEDITVRKFTAHAQGKGTRVGIYTYGRKVR